MSVHQRVIKKNFNRILKIKSVVSFQKDIQKIKFLSRFGVTSEIQTYVFTMPSPRNRRTVVGIESVQHLNYQSV